MMTLTARCCASLAFVALAASLTFGCNGGGEEDQVLTEPPAPTIRLAPPRHVSQLGLAETTGDVPDTAAGARLDWTLDLINVHYEGLTPNSLGENFSPSVFERVPVGDLSEMLVGIAANHGPIALVGFREAPTEHRLVAVIRFAGLQYRELTIGVDADQPNQIVEFQFAEF